MMSYKHIIWDWNGTLFDDVFLCLDIMNNILKRRNLNQISLYKYKNIFTFPVENYYRKAGLDLSKYDFAQLSVEFISEYEDRKLDFQLYNGIKDVLKHINDLGISQSILSAYSQHTLEETVDHYGIYKYFQRLAGLNNIYARSKIERGKEFISDLKIKEGEALLIGDTLHDLEVANEIGADCILIANGHQSKERLQKKHQIVLDDVKYLLKNLKGKI